MNLVTYVSGNNIGREDELNSENRAVVNNFQAELAQQVGSLCNTVATSLSEQNEHLKGVEKHCFSFLGIHDKVRTSIMPLFFLDSLSFFFCRCSSCF